MHGSFLCFVVETSNHLEHLDRSCFFFLLVLYFLLVTCFNHCESSPNHHFGEHPRKALKNNASNSKTTSLLKWSLFRGYVKLGVHMYLFFQPSNKQIWENVTCNMNAENSKQSVLGSLVVYQLIDIKLRRAEKGHFQIRPSSPWVSCDLYECGTPYCISKNSTFWKIQVHLRYLYVNWNIYIYIINATCMIIMFNYFFIFFYIPKTPGANQPGPWSLGNPRSVARVLPNEVTYSSAISSCERGLCLPAVG